MAHTTRNFPTKKALKEALKQGEKVFMQENPFFGGFGTYGGNKATIEGPWEYHKWYASATIDPQTGEVLTVK